MDRQEQHHLQQPLLRKSGGSADSRIEYACQVGIVYLVVVTSLVNISLKIGNSELWKFLLLTFVGYFLPPPSLARSSKFRVAAAAVTAAENGSFGQPPLPPPISNQHQHQPLIQSPSPPT